MLSKSLCQLASGQAQIQGQLAEWPNVFQCWCWPTGGWFRGSGGPHVGVGLLMSKIEYSRLWDCIVSGAVSLPPLGGGGVQGILGLVHIHWRVRSCGERAGHSLVEPCTELSG